MMSGTCSRPFKMSLFKNAPDTIHELLRREDKYVDAEDAFFISKCMKDRKEPESNKIKSRNELKPRDDKGKQKMKHLTRNDQPSWKVLEHTLKSTCGNYLFNYSLY
ncbi:Uncharacterized protein Adt_44889 [Abeliophyllum distichum]|uniref:Uncharacterized protein n=1 Tax=Abeliophyllum distichum TaxID=126358 RepID=A0ABD1PEI0_9LAMI